MADVRLVPFEPAHLHTLRVQPRQRAMRDATPAAVLSACARLPSFTALVGDEPLACFGMAPIWPGRALLPRRQRGRPVREDQGMSGGGMNIAASAMSFSGSLEAGRAQANTEKYNEKVAENNAQAIHDQGVAAVEAQTRQFRRALG